ncbi:MAG: HIT family protein [Polyangiaceae bacterium]
MNAGEHENQANMSDRLWAPWRMKYILGDKGGPCIFCDFACIPREAYREKLVLVSQPHALLCLNRYPFAAGHLLVSPRRHTSELSDLSVEEYDGAMRLVRDATLCLKRATAPEGVNIGLNLGRAAGAGIADHLHAHVVPRWSGDSNFMPVIADIRVMPEYLDESWQRLAPFFADLPGEHPVP